LRQWAEGMEQVYRGQVFILDIIENGVIVLKAEAHLFLMDKQPHTGLFLPGYRENTISGRV